MPKTVSKIPNAVLLLSSGMTSINTACNNESWALVPIPHKTIPINAKFSPPRNVKGAKKAEKAITRIAAMCLILSSSFPNISAVMAAEAIATANKMGIIWSATIPDFWKLYEINEKPVKPVARRLPATKYIQ